VIKISSLQLYEELATLEHIKSLAFNRTSSSTGETEAMNYIDRVLTESNIKSEIEHFEWKGPLRILMRVSYVIAFAYLLVFRLFLVIIVYYIIKNLFDKTRKMTLIKEEESKNIFTKIPAQEQASNRPLVIFSAHYDSISANIPYKLQVIIFIIYRLLMVFYVFIMITFSTLFILEYFAIAPISDFFLMLIIGSSIGGVVSSIPILYLVFVEKPSSGSIDNASGVAILLELAKLFKNKPLKNIDVLILWTGAEEWGLKGSKNFCARHFKALKQVYDLDKSFNINLDMIGTYIGLFDKSGLIIRRKLNTNLNDILEATAKQLNTPIIRYHKVIKPKSDYKTFRRYARKVKKKKFQVSCFHSSKDSKYIHSSKDTPDKCSTENLNGCINICYQTLRSIDSRVEVS
jgi:hypothetical protein